MTRSISSGRIAITLSATLTSTMTDSSSVSVSHPALSYSKSPTSGLDDNQLNRTWQSKNRAIASGAQETIDLQSLPDIGAGEGEDGVGLAAVFQEIVAIAIVNENTLGTDGLLEIVPSASEGWTPIGSHTNATGGALYGQGVLLKIQLDERGFSSIETSHRITLRAIGAAVTYSIYLMGRSDTDESSVSSLSLSSLSSISTSSSSISTSSISTSSSSQSRSESSLSSSSLSASSLSESSSSMSSSV
jgi:hypothetical protein